MARPSIPAHVLAQRGKRITLIDGTEVAVCYTFSSLMRLEEDFGSIENALQEINKGERGAAFTGLGNIMAAGLEHASWGEDALPLDDLRNLRTLLDPMQFEAYSTQLGEALAAAFPSNLQDEGGEGDADPQTDSRGESGITSPPSPSDAVSTSSGTA